MGEETVAVAANADDGGWYGANFNTFNATFGRSGGNTFHSFFRFTSVTIPNGATIVSAKLQFRAATTLTGATCNAKIHCEASDNPAAPTTAADANGRSLTTGTNWDSVESWTSGTWYDSPDITDEVQAVVDRENWQQDNAMVIFVKDNTSSSTAYRESSVREGGASYGAKLVVTFYS